MNRFWNRILKTDDCWLWHGGRNAKGYGQFRVTNGAKPRVEYVHRHAYALLVGPLKSEECLLHACDNPRCVNPKHLRVGSIAENNREMWTKGRGWSPFTERLQAKVTKEAVKEMRVLAEAGALQKDLARRFGLDESHVSRIVNKRVWKDV